MIFEEGYLKKYSILRHKKPSIYNLEELYFKVLPFTLKQDGTIWLDDKNLTEEPFVTLNFPEFLDVSNNLSLIKSVHFAMDISLNTKEDLQADDGDDEIRLIEIGESLGSLFEPAVSGLAHLRGLPIPPNLFRLYLGYRHTPLIDAKGHLEGIESLTTKRLAKMEDDCFYWIEVTDGEGVKQKTDKTSVLKYKVVFDLDVLRAWVNTLIPLPDRDAVFASLGKDELYFNFIVHPPYAGRMSFKNSITILYPQRTSVLKVIDRITFKTNRTYTEGNKLYKIEIIDKTSDQKLFVFDSVEHSELFTSIIKKIDTRKVNSYFDTELLTFRDSVTIDFNIPYPVQMVLSEHRNYKIRITAKDLTSLDKKI